MTYSANGLIQASDFNTLVGGNPTTTINTLNATWATGGAGAGYGQTAVANVTAGNSVLASSWAALVSNTASAASHQGSSITSVSAPVAGGLIAYNANIATNLTTIYTNKFNAGTQGSTTSNTVTTAATWSNVATFTFTATFANGDAARYFFNAGGQFALTCSHPSGTGINLLLNNLASNVGTVVVSSLTSGTANIAGTLYTGIQKVGGGGSTPTVSTNSGYFSLTTSNVNVFSQIATTGPAAYLSTSISYLVKTNGTVGSNGDRGNIVTIFAVWDEIPDGLVVAVGSVTTLTVRPPEQTNIANTWGTVTLAGSVVVS